MSNQRIIDVVPSEDFYAVFHYTKILTLLGCGETIKPDLYVRCPKCKTPTLWLSEMAPFGVWCYCDKCHMSCDPVKLYFEAYKIANHEDGLYRLAEDLEINDLSSELIASYVSFAEDYYKSVLGFWEHCRSNMYPRANALASGKLNELNLWRSQELYNRTFRNWFGFCYKSEAEERLGRKIHNLGKAPEGLLVMPFFLKPGFIIGFGFIGNKEQIHYVSLTKEHLGGFCGMNECHNSPNSKVYVVPHPLQAARIAQKCAIESYKKLTVISKSPVGQFIPSYIPRESVLWLKDSDADTLKSCITQHGFKIIEQDLPYIWSPKEVVSRLWENELMPIVHETVSIMVEMDPVLFFCRQIGEMSMTNARSLIDAMDLNQFQKGLILAACPDKLQDKFQDLLSSISSSKPIVVDKKLIFERDGKLWVQGSRETTDEVVCDAIVRILHVCRNKDSGRAILFGCMMFSGMEINFEIDEEVFSKAPASTIAKFAAAAGLPNQPILLDSISKKYLDILFRLSAPMVHSVQDFVGFDVDIRRFCLPKMAIDTQTVQVGVPFVAGDSLPCQNVTLVGGTSVSSLGGLFHYGPETVTYLAAMACLIANIHDVGDANERNNILFVGGDRSLSRLIFDTLCIDMGIERLTLHTKFDVTYAHALSKIHHVPVAIDGLNSRPALLSAWMEGEGSNSMVIADSVKASAVGNSRKWKLIRADIEYKEETPALIRSENAFPFFMQYSMTVKPGSPKMFLDSLKFFAKSLEAPLDALEAAKHVVSQQGLVNSKSNAAHFVNFVTEGVEKGIFRTFTGDPAANNKYVVVKDPINDCVYVNLTNLLSSMRAHHIPVISWESAVQQLEEMGVSSVSVDSASMLVFPKPVWNVFITSVKKMKQLRTAALKNLLKTPQ